MMRPVLADHKFQVNQENEKNDKTISRRKLDRCS